MKIEIGTTIQRTPRCVASASEIDAALSMSAESRPQRYSVAWLFAIAGLRRVTIVSMIITPLDVLASLLLTTLAIGATATTPTTPPPQPFGPVPSDRQLKWHELEVYGFLHF